MASEIRVNRTIELPEGMAVLPRSTLDELQLKAAAWDSIQGPAQTALEVWANQAYYLDDEAHMKAYHARNNLRRLLEHDE